MIRLGLELMFVLALGLVSAAALAADNPWRAPSQQVAPKHQYPPIERQATPKQVPDLSVPSREQSPAFPPPPGSALPQATPPAQPAPYGYGAPNRGYPTYPGYPGPTYAYPQPYPYPYSGPFPAPYPGGDPVLRDSLFRSGGWSGFPGGWR